MPTLRCLSHPHLGGVVSEAGVPGKTLFHPGLGLKSGRWGCVLETGP